MQPQPPTFDVTLDVGMPEDDGTVPIAISTDQPVYGVQGVVSFPDDSRSTAQPDEELLDILYQLYVSDGIIRLEITDSAFRAWVLSVQHVRSAVPLLIASTAYRAIQCGFEIVTSNVTELES